MKNTHFRFRSGKQQCVGGVDEDYCEKLLHNECDSESEYRCKSGHCIDEAYFLDGDVDCQNQTDEQINNDLHNIARCPYTTNFNCDEFIVFSKMYFSCADGNILYDRSLFQRDYVLEAYCRNYHDKYFMCELDSYNPVWTRPNGMCLYYGLTGERDENYCLFLHQCALTDGAHPECPCSGNDCKRFKYLGMELNSDMKYGASLDEIFFATRGTYRSFEWLYGTQVLNILADMGLDKSHLPPFCWNNIYPNTTEVCDRLRVYSCI
ncbi:unnamed protein product [Didymodactylos carnosus]|uniref:Uncharacterized protein n=1 Tax=Didymodactylos carnosus TaxID=1234261 RepID=A0A8S2CZC5_9BILA|nr:unnamed protein product [Didymodactylos carnosus]CAF3590661.1 unnamed protein product [Didymodactylos carnosus]